MPIFLKSNWVGLLPESTEYCDPLHLNYIGHIGADAGPGLAPGDLVLSLRNISRFVIFDLKTRRIKRVVGGSFAQQHSVHHLSGSKFLIFDNRGGDALGPAISTSHRTGAGYWPASPKPALPSRSASLRAGSWRFSTMSTISRQWRIFRRTQSGMPAVSNSLA